MHIATHDIPQADLIWDVARVPEALARNITTCDGIAAFLGGKVPRQGHYYAQAAQTLNLIKHDSNGELTLTTYGRAFLGYDLLSKRRALRRLVSEREPTRTIVAELRTKKVLSNADIAQLLQQLAPLSESTARRRATTIAKWLCTLGIAKKEHGALVYCSPILMFGAEPRQVA